MCSRGRKEGKNCAANLRAPQWWTRCYGTQSFKMVIMEYCPTFIHQSAFDSLHHLVLPGGYFLFLTWKLQQQARNRALLRQQRLHITPLLPDIQNHGVRKKRRSAALPGVQGMEIFGRNRRFRPNILPFRYRRQRAVDERHRNQAVALGHRVPNVKNRRAMTR